MISLGVLLVILGVGSLLLPYFGLQLTLMDWLNDYQPWIGIIVAAVGLITVLFGAQRRGREGAPAAVATAQSASPAEAPPPAEASAQSQAPPPERSSPSESRDRSDQP